MLFDLKRNCKYCKEKINLETDKVIIEVIKEKNNFFHYDCFINLNVLKKKNSITREEAEQKAQSLLNDSIAYINYEIAKKTLYRWLQKTYSITFFPSYFYVKMEQVFNGNYKGLSKKMSPTDIMDIWQRKILEFNKFNAYKRSKGDVIEGVNRINYDLAVVLSKYDSFKKWQSSQEQNQEQEKTMQYLTTTYNKNTDKAVLAAIEKEKQNHSDISDILEEI
jgi:hypothetical protein